MWHVKCHDSGFIFQEQLKVVDNSCSKCVNQTGARRVRGIEKNTHKMRLCSDRIVAPLSVKAAFNSSTVKNPPPQKEACIKKQQILDCSRGCIMTKKKKKQT